MNEKNYTSLELSKNLAENGFDRESDFMRISPQSSDKGIFIKVKGGEGYKSYDILNDLCVSYSKELFGGSHLLKCHTVMYLMNVRNNQDVENYIRDSCLFNPKNK